MYSIAYNPKALEEYEQSVEWYAERSIQASENFIIEVQRCIKAIKNNPTGFKNRYRNYYEITLQKYPFDIVYIIDTEKIVIVSVYHHKRNPKKKYRK
ncbi:MAG: type II toxin-antitoxin system RelE/ParE family toxin [Flavobacteriaceae bacterium]|jgi:plasmid stabilization system protein ParE|nr:type II toxin-antitoxin system RelE/ParE family toxin [Flavobacteriaceae bacterium]